MAFNQQHRNENERDKFVEASDGTPAVRMKIDSITLSENSILEVKDHRKFVIFSIDEATGDITHKGDFIKI